jgi:hypothetical protein
MAQEYKLTSKRQFEPIKKSKWFYLSALAVIGICMFIPFELAIWIVLFMVGIPIILQIILHLNYFMHDRNTTLKMDFLAGTIEVANGNSTSTITFDEIEKITRTQGSRHPKPFDHYVVPSNFYHFTTIETKSGKQFKFTDLLYPNFSISTKKAELRVKPLLNWIK